MVKKLLYDMLFSLLGGQPGQKKKFFKNHFLTKNKFEIDSLDLFVWKVLNHSIFINEMKVMRSFSLG